MFYVLLHMWQTRPIGLLSFEVAITNRQNNTLADLINLTDIFATEKDKQQTLKPNNNGTIKKNGRHRLGVLRNTDRSNVYGGDGLGLTRLLIF